MKVYELIEKLEEWPQDAEVMLADELDNFHPVLSVTEWTAYDQFYVVLGWFES